jgi:uncharacterized membrane protein
LFQQSLISQKELDYKAKEPIKILLIIMNSEMEYLNLTYNFKSNKRLLILLISLILVFLGSICIDQIGITIPIIRSISAFFLFLLIPGFLFLKIIRYKNTDTGITILLCLGISIAFAMGLGFAINHFFPLFGIVNPLSLNYLTISFLLSILILTLIVCFRPNNPFFPKDDNLKDIILYHVHLFISPLGLLIISIPILSIVGNYINQNYGNNFLLILNVCLIITLIFVLAVKKSIPKFFFPCSIIAISIGILFLNSLVSPYPPRLNVDLEYSFLNSVLQNGYWDSNIVGPSNSVLSIVILGPIMSTLMGLNINSLFTVFYPVIFAVIPLSLYYIFSIYFTPETSLFSVIFFISVGYFFDEGLLLRRQQIAFLFVTLIFLLLFIQNIEFRSKKLLLLIFSCGLVVSHYSVGIFILIVFFLSYMINILVIFLRTPSQYFKSFLYSSNQFKERGNFFYSKLSQNLPFSIFIFLTISSIMWYIFIGFQFEFLSTAGIKVFSNLLLDDPSNKGLAVSAAVGTGFWSSPLPNQLWRILQYLSEVFIILGLIWNIRKKGLLNDYVTLGMANMIFLFVAMFIPYVSVYINVQRFYFFTLFILSPFCVEGALFILGTIYILSIEIINPLQLNVIHVLNKINSFFVSNDIKSNCDRFLKVFVIFFIIPYFMFNVGFIFSVAGFNENTRSLAKIPSFESLSSNKIDAGYPSENEIFAAKQMSNFISSDSTIIGEDVGSYNTLTAWFSNVDIYRTDKDIPPDTFIFFRNWNMYHNQIKVFDTKKQEFYFISVPKDLLSQNMLLYNNGGTAIIKTREQIETKKLTKLTM